MLKDGNKQYRNLQEQVLANMRNIEDIIKDKPIMATYKIKIVGSVGSSGDLPDPLTYKGDLGDIYVVGTKSPFDLYVFGKEYENEDAPSWINLGPIWVEGPKGETGAQGPAGQDGKDGAGVPEIESGDAGKALVVNQAEDGVEWATVTAGLSPEDQAKLDNSLQLPESAPATEQLVSIDTNGDQNALGIGAGLEVSNGALINGVKVLTINAEFESFATNSVDVVLTDEIVTNMLNNVYSLVLLKTSDNISKDFVIVANEATNNSYFSYVGNSIPGTTQNFPYIVPGFVMSKQIISYRISKKSNTTDTIRVTRNKSTVVNTEKTWDISIKLAGGTLSVTDYTCIHDAEFQTPLLLSGVTGVYYIKLYNCYYSSSAIVYRNIPCGDVPTQYEVVITPSTRAYVVNTIA